MKAKRRQGQLRLEAHNGAHANKAEPNYNRNSTERNQQKIANHAILYTLNVRWHLIRHSEQKLIPQPTGNKHN